ncbi:hypothetical protein Csa_006944 [Cucumis sativus]|uniref:DDE Tnp4 domain-containing protein n=1 Tax=Cucumis sativus TaxID=3659 RepID=A0A0A0M0G4_CUCSA|nr:hypothetical protein Csa_006944 [Cucumis sativus]
MACCLLHNLINREITNVKILKDVDEVDLNYATTEGNNINYNEASNKWSQWRDDLVEAMFNGWQLCNH